ncbi:hypothetical protein EA908_29475, partial [Vibrio anguillarum]|nr:hypothetical protein [Vibrio anguillarum]
WDAVNHKFKMEHERAVPLWNPESEDGLALDITVKFKNGETYKETMYLSDVDYSFRSLNDSWASSPKKQLFNYTIRNIGHFALSNIVNYFDSSDEMKEQDANEKVKKSKPSNISQGNGTQQSEHITLTQLKVIAESILNMASSLSGQNK